MRCRSPLARVIWPTVCVVAVVACGPGWRPFVATPAEQPPAGQVIEFHVADTLVRLHAVHVTRDSISGVPWLQHPGCDSCRTAFALDRVSALRSGNPGAGAENILAVMLGIGLFIAGMYAAFAGNAT